MNTFEGAGESASVFRGEVITLEVVEHEFSSIRCDPREIRGN